MTAPPVTKSPGRGKGLPDADLSQRAIGQYRRELRKRANEGETIAIAALLLIETLKGATPE